jgi:uncharacterized protein YukE
MADNILTMTLQMRNHAKTTVDNLKTSLHDAGNAAQTFGTKFGKAIKASHTSAGGLLATLVSLKTIIIAAFVYKSVQNFTGWLSKLSKAADEDTEALVRLRQGLASFGNYSAQTEDTLVSLASKLQAQTGVADDVSKSMMGLLGTYNMTGEQIQRLTPLVIDFAKAKGIELKTAFDLVGKANMGYTGTLSRYGIILDENLSKEEKMIALEELMSKYKGTAAELTKTYGGQVEVLSANYGDLREEMGRSLQAGVQQSGILELLSQTVANATEWWKKWGVVVADVVAKGLRGTADMLKTIGKIVISSPVLWVFTELSFIIKTVYYVTKAYFTILKAGLQHASNLMTLVIAKFKQLIATIFGSKEEKEQAKLVAEEVARGFWDEVNRINKEMNEKQGENYAKIAENAKWAAKLWTTDGFKEWKQNMEEKQKLLQESADKQRALAQQNVVNGEQQNEVIQRTIQLTRTMAQQFATASRLEQEQTKYLLEKLRNIKPEDIGNLSEQEKKLINKQGVLKQAYEGVFSEYAEKELGIKAEDKELKAKLTIELTEEAAKLLRAKGEADKEYRNVQFETKAVG